MSEPLTTKEQRALESLLAGATDQVAADAAGVVRQTVLTWRQRPDFTEALARARADLLERTTARLHSATTAAVTALEDVANDTSHPAARVSAARAIIGLSQRAVEIGELQRRVEQLELDFGEPKP